MTVHDKRLAKTHDDILEAIAEALDIPPSKFEEAKSRYEAIGNWLDRPESTLADYNPAISPQGSFLLGTVTRPLTEAEEYDVDLGCRLKATKAEFTQKSLKEAVGYEVALYAKAQSMPEPEEHRRCWRLNYAASAQFHMDIVPSLPDAQRYQAELAKQGYRDLALDAGLTGHAIAITDNTLPHYDVRTEDWPQSNPLGYAEVLRVANNRRQLLYHLRLLSQDWPKGHWRCPCGSGKRLRYCHRNELEVMHQRVRPDIARRMLRRLNPERREMRGTGA